MINFISGAAVELMMALFFVNRKQMDFLMMLLFIHWQVQPSMNLSYTHLTEVYLPFISTNQWHYQVISCFSRDGIVRFKHQEKDRPVKIFHMDKLNGVFADFEFGDAGDKTMYLLMPCKYWMNWCSQAINLWFVLTVDFSWIRSHACA